MFKAYKYRLYPNAKQRELLEKHFGCVRFIYNKGLELKSEAWHRDKTKLTRYDLQREIVKLKKSSAVWLREVNAQALQFALFNLDTAFTRFFRKKSGFPRMKSRRNAQAFSCPQQNRVDFSRGLFHTVKFKEGIKAKFSREFAGKIKTCTVSKTASGKYFVSILVEESKATPEPIPAKLDSCVGIDLGIKDFAVFSDGSRVENPKFLHRKLKKLRRASRAHSRKVKGGKNRAKSRVKLARIHENVANARRDFHHKLAKSVAENQGYGCVAMESLAIQEMQKKTRGKLPRYIADAGWYQFKTILKYKLEDRGKTLIEIERFAPSSKTCSCGCVNAELKLAERVWTCKSCAVTHDRDLLAAQNIRKFAFLGRGAPDFKSAEKSVGISAKQKGAV